MIHTWLFDGIKRKYCSGRNGCKRTARNCLLAVEFVIAADDLTGFVDAVAQAVEDLES